MMKTITEYINESIQLNESTRVKVDDLMKNLKKIEKWNTPDNIKKLISKQMSAGDAEEYSKKHWDTCALVVKNLIEDIEIFITSPDYTEDGYVDTYDLYEWIDDTWDDTDPDIDDYNDMDEEGDWDEDSCVDLFNMVSMKVCKEVWLVD